MPRQLAILFPNAPTEYWLTTRVFNLGDRIERNGTAWVVTSITTPDGHKTLTAHEDSRHATITVQRDGDCG
jgi:hypothetical protein